MCEKVEAAESLAAISSLNCFDQKHGWDINRTKFAIFTALWMLRQEEGYDEEAAVAESSSDHHLLGEKRQKLLEGLRGCDTDVITSWSFERRIMKIVEHKSTTAKNKGQAGKSEDLSDRKG